MSGIRDVEVRLIGRADGDRVLSLDVNVLVYASNQESPFHTRAQQLIGSLAEHDDLICLTWSVLFGYVRIATHPRIFDEPLSPAAAQANVEQLLALPRCRVITELDGFWRVYREVVGKQVLRGNLVPDAHLAALLKQHGVKRLYTADADFRRFEFLDVIDPFANSE